MEKNADKILHEAIEKQEVLEEKDEQKIVQEDETLSDKERELEREIERGYRIVNYRGKVYHIDKLSIEVKDEAALAKSIEYTKLLNKGALLPLKKLREKLQASGLWTEENDAEIEQKRDKYFALNEKLKAEERKKKPNKAKLADFKKKAETAKFDFLTSVTEKTQAEQHSIEAHTDKIETYAKLALCVYEVNGNSRTRTWDAETLEEAIKKVKQEKDELLFAFINWQADSFWNGYNPDFLGDWQEDIVG